MASALDRLLSRTQETAAGCIEWQGAVGSHGYGVISLDGRLWLAHRLHYTLAIGPIPDGMTLDHLCRNKVCVRPSHLEPVTLAENLARAARARTHCSHGHEYNDENSYWHYRTNSRWAGWERICRPCKRAKRARERQKPRELIERAS